MKELLDVLMHGGPYALAVIPAVAVVALWRENTRLRDKHEADTREMRAKHETDILELHTKFQAKDEATTKARIEELKETMAAATAIGKTVDTLDRLYERELGRTSPPRSRS